MRFTLSVRRDGIRLVKSESFGFGEELTKGMEMLSLLRFDSRRLNRIMARGPRKLTSRWGNANHVAENGKSPVCTRGNVAKNVDCWTLKKLKYI
jgi:hypothetical protein